MVDSPDVLIVDLLEWIVRKPRTYSDVMDAWRTTCPRLTVWEDAVDLGFVVRSRDEDGEVWIRITDKGYEQLR